MRLSRARITCASLSRFILKMPIICLGRTMSEEEEEAKSQEEEKEAGAAELILFFLS